MRWLLLLSVAGAALARAQIAPSTVARIDAVFGRYTSLTPGCALLVRRAGATLYSHAYGAASLDLDVPIVEQTVFNLGSVSKQFTAASVLLLASDGKLSLDDDVRKYVPELPDLGARITLRQLLTHTSGWRDYIQLLVWQGHEVRDHVTQRDAMNVLQRQRALNFAPGAEFRYSNTGYFLLSLDRAASVGNAARGIREASGSSSRSACMTRATSTDMRDVIPGTVRRATSPRLALRGAKRCRAGSSRATGACTATWTISPSGTTISHPGMSVARRSAIRSPQPST